MKVSPHLPVNAVYVLQMVGIQHFVSILQHLHYKENLFTYIINMTYITHYKYVL